VVLNPDELPKGWVKEDVFRKTERSQKNLVNETRASRTLKSAIHYPETVR
jgi:hypothetical protein